MFDLLKKKLAEFASGLAPKNGGTQPDSFHPTQTVTDWKGNRELEKPVFLHPKETVPVSQEVEPANFPEPHPAQSPSAPDKPPKDAAPREIKARVGLVDRLQGHLTGQITLTEGQLAPALEELELALLEADVDLDASAKIRDTLKAKLSGKPILTSEGTEKGLKRIIRETLFERLNVPGVNVLEKIRQKKTGPIVILFTGPNGAGKTTSMAKLTHYLNQNKISTVWSASDTFRAASIEQLEVHAQRLNVRLVKHAYGSDPAAVAFDAIAAAKAGKIDCVLLDSAGRQETNSNLMSELSKLKRVAKPDLVVFVGESYAGQSLLDMAREFDKALGLDGFILTKLDTDPKGGTILSLVIELQKPVLFLGTGQEYADWEAFDAKRLVERIVGN